MSRMVGQPHNVAAMMNGGRVNSRWNEQARQAARQQQQENKKGNK